MSAITNIIYGFVSGIAEFLPISSRAHQALLRYLFGIDTRIPFQDFLVHIGVLVAIFVSCSEIIGQLLREQTAIANNRYRKRNIQKSKVYYDLCLLKTAFLPLFIGSFIYFITAKYENNLLLIMAFLIVNAVILFLVDHMPRGNRDARTMSFLDGIIMGIVSIFAVLPGISRTGMITSYTLARGVDTEKAANWSVLLAIPAILFSLIFDFVSLFRLGFGVHSFGAALCCFLAGITAFGGGYLGITVFKLILNHSGLSKFGYYTIGVSVFAFLTYLIT